LYFDHLFLLESNTSRIPKETIEILREWLESNVGMPNASLDILSEKTNLSKSQITSWMYRNKKKISDNKFQEHPDKISRKNIQILMDRFKKNDYPLKSEVDELVYLTKLEKKKIHDWFSWERYKKKHNVINS
jgi:hypothetical protein